MPDSIGIVEVHGLSASLAVADAMCKAGNVRIPGIETNALGGMGIKVVGSTADVRMAVEAGETLSQRMNAHVAHGDWPHYSDEAEFLVYSKQEYNALLEANDHLLAGRGPERAEQNRKAPGKMAQEAIGVVETQGLTALLAAADAMCKAANVRIIGKEKIGAAYISVLVSGDVAAVKAAVEAGTAAVENVGGKLILASVIARPHEELVALLPKREQQ